MPHFPITEVDSGQHLHRAIRMSPFFVRIHERSIPEYEPGFLQDMRGSPGGSRVGPAGRRMGWPLQHASRRWQLRRAGGPLGAARPLRAQLRWELELQASSPGCMELVLSHACIASLDKMIVIAASRRVDMRHPFICCCAGDDHHLAHRTGSMCDQSVCRWVRSWIRSCN